ncbi:MAG: molybdenum cofactor guanylyltransferase MobA [Pseudomonadota bacterium]
MQRHVAAPPPVTGVILAGGRGRRLGGRDKGLIEFAGQTLVERIAAALAPQVNELLISANRNLEQYRRTGYPVVTDRWPDFRGPLAGMLAGLEQASHEHVVFVPCDTPTLPPGLVSRLGTAMARGDRQAAMVHDGMRAHPVYSMLSRDCAATLRARLIAGHYRVEDAMTQLDAVTVDFSDRPEAFFNINEPDDLRELARTGETPSCMP